MEIRQIARPSDMRRRSQRCPAWPLECSSDHCCPPLEIAIELLRGGLTGTSLEAAFREETARDYQPTVDSVQLISRRADVVDSASTISLSA